MIVMNRDSFVRKGGAEIEKTNKSIVKLLNLKINILLINQFNRNTLHDIKMKENLDKS